MVVIVDPVTDARKSEKIDTWVNRMIMKNDELIFQIGDSKFI